MSDYISRNAITQVLNTMHRYVADELTLCDTEKKFPRNEVFVVDDVYEEIIEQLPPADVRENIHGEWINNENGTFTCNKCGELSCCEGKFCCECGADMRPEPCKGCIEPCIMYEPDMRGCKKKVTEKGKADGK